jgi:serine/threonine-protein phosphatase 2B regulatory subunit
MQIPAIANNPLASRMIAIFDEEWAADLFITHMDQLRALRTDLNLVLFPSLLYFFLPSSVYSGGGTVDFQEFVDGLSAFSSRGDREQKLKCE